jgi:ribosomal protein S18 acetylase RimI-like enzyme
MLLNSLGIRMDLAFHRHFSQIVEKRDYIVVKTPERPSFFWGNYIIMRNPPKDGCHLSWIEIMVGDLGVYWENEIAIFTNVGTHRDFRRMGVCNTLVYEVSCKLLENPNINVLALETDENYHAARIYESVGFKPTERLIHLEWRDEARFG